MRGLKSKNTHIYWLFDTRPQTVREYGAPFPFYCGKTFRDTKRRLAEHCSNARRQPDQTLYRRVLECSGHIEIRVIETVPSGIDWVFREAFWIAELRRLNPNCVNTSPGGAYGATGIKWTADQRAALSAKRKGTKRSAETRAKLAEALKRARSNRKGMSEERQLEIRRLKLEREERRVRKSKIVKVRPAKPPITEQQRFALRLARLARAYPGGLRAHKKRFAYMYE